MHKNKRYSKFGIDDPKAGDHSHHKNWMGPSKKEINSFYRKKEDFIS